ncbi:hypothetical protein D3C71_1495430 [compost metagenome]
MLHQGIDALQPFHVHRQAIQEDAGQRMPAHLRQGRIRRGIFAVLGMGIVTKARAYHHDAVRAQMNGRADRRQLAHGAVAAPFALAMHLHLPRGEHKRNR